MDKIRKTIFHFLKGENMDKIRKTIKTRERSALAAPRGDDRELVEVVVTTFKNPRNENEWRRVGIAFCDSQHLDFIRFTGDPVVVADVYEMELTDFLLSATLVEPKEKEEE